MTVENPPLLVDQIGSSLLITFNRPAIRNPLSLLVVDEITLLIKNSETNTQIDRIIFTGGRNVFAAGANLNEVLKTNSETARSFAEAGQAMMSAIENSSKITIAAISGHCYGGALDLALSCDFRLASANAKFCHPGANIGIMTGWGGTQKLPRLVGEAAALEMLLTAKPVSALRAKEIGLINEIVDEPINQAINYQLLS